MWQSPSEGAICLKTIPAHEQGTLEKAMGVWTAELCTLPSYPLAALPTWAMAEHLRKVGRIDASPQTSSSFIINKKPRARPEKPERPLSSHSSASPFFISNAMNLGLEGCRLNQPHCLQPRLLGFWLWHNLLAIGRHLFCIHFKTAPLWSWAFL